MLRNVSLRPYYLIALSATLSHTAATLTQDETNLTSSTLLSYIRRERATRVLTIASAVEPEETAKALKLARTSIRTNPPITVQSRDRTFLQHTCKEAFARGIACAAGGAAASYAIIKVVLLVIPVTPTPFITRAAISVVSFGAAAVELAAFPDITTVELLMMKDSDLGQRARRTIEKYNPHSLLLHTVDRHLREEQQLDMTTDSPRRAHPTQMDDFFVDGPSVQDDQFAAASDFQFR